MKKSRKPLLLIMLACSSMLFMRCSFTEDLNKLQSAVDSVKLVVGTPEFKNIAHFEFVDAANNQPILSAIKLKISGNDASKVYNNIGEHEVEYAVTNGMLDLVLDPHLDSLTLAGHPVRFEITPVLNGYLGQTQQVEIKGERLKFVPVPLVNLAASGSVGIKVSTETLTPTFDAEKKTAQTVVQQIDGSNTTIEIPTGTVLKDASGIPLSGNIASQVVFFDAKDSVAQNAIQASLLGEAKLQNGESVQTKLISAGMFSAQLTSDGKVVKSIDGEGLKLKTRISADLYNPEKDRVVAENDTIPMWSKEEGSGVWKQEKISVVKRDAEGLYLEDVVNHLSYWNWDWFTHTINRAYCSTFPRILWNLSGLTSADININVTLNNVNSQYPVMQESVYQGAYSDFGYFPANVGGIIKFSDRNPKPGRKLIFNPATISFTSLCGTTNKVNVSVEANTDLLTINLNLSAKSTDATSRIVVKPSTYLYYRPSSQTGWSQFKMTDGVGSIQLLAGQDYTIYGVFGKNSGYGTLRIDKVGTDKLQVKLTPTMNLAGGTVGQAVTLPAITRPSNNIINVVYTALLSPSVFDKLK